MMHARELKGGEAESEATRSACRVRRCCGEGGKGEQGKPRALPAGTAEQGRAVPDAGLATQKGWSKRGREMALPRGSDPSAWPQKWEPCRDTGHCARSLAALDALGTMAALVLGWRERQAIPPCPGSRDQGAKNWRAEGGGIALTQKEEAGREGRQERAEGGSRAGDRGQESRASTGQGRFSDRRNSPPGRQKHRVSIWHKVSTERSKIP